MNPDRPVAAALRRLKDILWLAEARALRAERIIASNRKGER